MRNTFIFVIGVVPVSEYVLSLAIALLLNEIKWLSSFFRTVYFLPFVTSTVAISLVWSWIYHTRFGLMNYFLSFLGIDLIAWLTDPKYAMLSGSDYGYVEKFGIQYHIVFSWVEQY